MQCTRGQDNTRAPGEGGALGDKAVWQWAGKQSRQAGRQRAELGKTLGKYKRHRGGACVSSLVCRGEGGVGLGQCGTERQGTRGPWEGISRRRLHTPTAGRHAQMRGPAARILCASSGVTWPPPSSNFLLQGAEGGAVKEAPGRQRAVRTATAGAPGCRRRGAQQGGPRRAQSSGGRHGGRREALAPCPLTSS